MRTRCKELNFFFFNDTATTEIYTLSLHDALPILTAMVSNYSEYYRLTSYFRRYTKEMIGMRSEEHTSELQSQSNLVCRLLLEKKKIGTALGVYTLWVLLPANSEADYAKYQTANAA